MRLAQQSTAGSGVVTQQLNILVRGPNWLGDLVMATPGFRALRSSFPDSRISLQVREGLEPVVAGSPWFDEVIPLRSHHRGLLAMWSEARELRRAQKFDLGICLPDSFSSVLMMRMAGVSRIVGYEGRGRGALLHDRVAVPASWGRRRMVAREQFVLGLMKAVGCQEDGTHLELFSTEEEELRAVAALRNAGLGEAWDRPIFIMAPGASFGPSKCWPAANFSRVGDAAALQGACVVVIGEASETELGRSVCSAMTGPVTNLVGRLDLGSLKALVRRSAGVVCNDAGARHLAVAFGVPCGVLMGPTSLLKTPMNLSSVRIFETEVDCRPCYLRECPIDHRCMTRLPVEEVTSFALDSISRTTESRVTDS
jgi:heptosyltransferase-2